MYMRSCFVIASYVILCHVIPIEHCKCHERRVLLVLPDTVA